MRLRHLGHRRLLQLAATATGGVTVATLLLFLLGEVLAGTISGLFHLVQLAPLAALLAFGWRAPSRAGWLLLGVGTALAGAYLLQVDSAVPVGERLLVAAIFLLPPMIAGALFVLAGRDGTD